MKNYNAKSFACGLLIGGVVIASIFTAITTTAAKNNGEKNTSEQSIQSETKEVKRAYACENTNPNGSGNNGGASIYYTVKDSLTNETDKRALEIMQKTGNWKYVEPLFPSMTSEGVQAVVNLYIEKTGNYKQAEKALPYINKSQNTSSEIKTQSDYDTLADQSIEKTGDINSIMVYIPHMSKEKVDKVVKEYIDKTNNFNCSYAIRQYMSTKGIDDIVQGYIEKTNDYGTVAAMLQFMSEDASKSVAEKYVNESKDQKYRRFFIPYL